MTEPTPAKVVICDDDPHRAAAWKSQIQNIPGIRAFDYDVIDGERLATEIKILSRRREAARDTATDSGEYSVFDDADIAVLDYDLTPDKSMYDEFTDRDSSFEDLQRQLRGRTGELVAYLARSYSTVGYLVVVNQQAQDLSFDLTMQRFATSKADLNVTWESLVSPALWTGRTADGGLNAWSWPCLEQTPELWRRRLAAASLDAKVLDALGIDPIKERLAARQIDVLTDAPHVMSPDLADITFRDVVDSSLGLNPKDIQNDEKYRLRIAVSVVGRWLDHWIMPGQNVLIDEPHIAALFPSAHPTAAEEVDWKSAVAPDARIASPIADLTASVAGFHQRSVWPLSEVRTLARKQPLPPDPQYDLAFCEDVSAFRQVDECTEVETDVAGPFVQRFVRKLDGVRYYPLTRLYS